MEPLGHSVAPLDRETRMLATQALLETRGSAVRCSRRVKRVSTRFPVLRSSRCFPSSPRSYQTQFIELAAWPIEHADTSAEEVFRVRPDQKKGHG